MTWLIWALLSAFFAGLTAILAKVGSAGYQFQSCNRHSHRRNPCFRMVGCARIEQTADLNYFRKDMALLNTFRIGHRALMAVLLSCAAIGRGIASRPHRQTQRRGRDRTGCSFPARAS